MATHIDFPPTTVREHDTAQLTDSGFLREDPFALLDYRDAAKAVAAVDAMPGHYLAIVDGEGDEHFIPLEDAITHVGRASAADLRFEDVHVSRRHAIVVRYGDHVRLLDDRSSAGTFLNGRRVIAGDMASGDVIRIGPITFTYLRIR